MTLGLLKSIFLNFQIRDLLVNFSLISSWTNWLETRENVLYGFFLICVNSCLKFYFQFLQIFFPCILEMYMYYLGAVVSFKEKAMETHSSTLAWKIPWTEEPGRLQSMGSRRVRHDWVTSLSLFTFIHWRRKWQPTPVFLPGESQGWQSLVGFHLWGRRESDTTEVT